MSQHVRPTTEARVNLATKNNETWQDAFQFDDEDDTSWSFTDQLFRLDVKADKDDVVALLSLTTDNGQIVVDDVVLRILHLNLPDNLLRLALLPGRYVYDLIMYDTSDPPVRTALMSGHVDVVQGVTGD